MSVTSPLHITHFLIDTVHVYTIHTEHVLNHSVQTTALA